MIPLILFNTGSHLLSDYKKLRGPLWHRHPHSYQGAEVESLTLVSNGVKFINIYKHVYNINKVLQCQRKLFDT